MNIIYLHGLSSSGQSHTAQKFRELAAYKSPTATLLLKITSLSTEDDG